MFDDLIVVLAIPLTTHIERQKGTGPHIYLVIQRDGFAYPEGAYIMSRLKRTSWISDPYSSR